MNKYIIQRFGSGMLLLLMLLLAGSAIAQTTIDLDARVPAGPAGTVKRWYATADRSTSILTGTNAIPVTSTPTNYWVFYYHAGDLCYSPGAKVTVVTNVCPVATVNLTTLPGGSGTGPNGTSLVWHTSSIPVTGTTNVPDATATGPGTYYAFYYDAVNQCYSPASSPVIVVGTVCAVPDLTPTITLNNANFASSGTQKNFAVNIFELLGASTSSAIAVQVSVAPGYELLDFNPALTSVNVSGAGAVSVQNSNWTLYSTPNVRTKVFTSANGFTLNRDDASLGQSSFGLSLKRVSASSGSTGNITVTIITDPSKTYDSNFLNNVFVRVLTSN